MRLQPDGRRHKPRTEDTLSWDVPFSVSGRIGVSILHRPTLYPLIATAPLSDQRSDFYHLERGGWIIIHQMLCNDDGTGPFPVRLHTFFELSGFKLTRIYVHAISLGSSVGIRASSS
jgi:hypothetical protein